MSTTVETITIITTADAWLNQFSPTWNYGNSSILEVGQTAASAERRPIVRFPIPFFNGKIISIKLRVWLRVISGGDMSVGVHVADSPQDDLWVEGVTIGAVDPKGCSWNEYARTFNWDTSGGDYSSDPVGLRRFLAADPINAYYDIDIPIDNIDLQSGETVSFFLIDPAPSGAIIRQFDSKENTNPALLVIEVEVEGFEPPEVTIEPLSSSELRIGWTESELNALNFDNYLVEQSDTGVGGWSTLTTITEQDITSYDHTGLVVQGDVDDFDEDSDTYPNGRTKYYRVTVVSNGFGSATSSVENGTTIPVVRPAQMGFTPKSMYWNNVVVDDNILLTPYGVEVILSWYDSDDITQDQYVDYTEYEVYFRGASTWPGAASATENGSVIDLSSGHILEGDVGYKPYKVKGKIYDTGGLYRKYTTDKTNEQFDVTWPAPCPVAIPNGPFANDPPDMYGPFDSITPVPVDLSFAGQQYGNEYIFFEDFAGSSLVNWKLRKALGSWWTVAQNPGSSIDLSLLNGFPTGGSSARVNLDTYLNDESTSVYNKFFSKYTGAYHGRMITTFFGWTFGGPVEYMDYYFCGWTLDTLTTTIVEGYHVRFDSTTPGTVDVYSVQTSSPWTPSSRLIGSFTLTGFNHFQNTAWFLVEMFISPHFGSGEGDVVVLVVNQGTSLADAKNFDYDTNPNIFVMTDSSKPSTVQPHATGKMGIGFITLAVQSGVSILRLNEAWINGRVTELTFGQGYGAKNLTYEQIFDLVNSPIPSFPITCAPDQASQACYIEGRIKNQFGTQSRTGEVDDYQGDTFTNTKPIAVLLVPGTGLKDNPIVANASLSSDPEGGDLVYEYDFDDGSPLVVSIVNIEYHTYTSIGTYTVKLRVQDEAGLWSDQVESDIVITDAGFVPLTFICPEPFTDMALVREDGDTETPISGSPTTYYQNNKTGGRKFAISGVTVECANLTQSQLVDNAKAEINLLDLYYREGTLVEIDLPSYGIIKGFITAFKPIVDKSNLRFWSWSMMFKEVDNEQLGG